MDEMLKLYPWILGMVKKNRLGLKGLIEGETSGTMDWHETMEWKVADDRNCAWWQRLNHARKGCQGGFKRGR